MMKSVVAGIAIVVLALGTILYTHPSEDGLAAATKIMVTDAGSCSGVMVAPHKLLTAGHCSTESGWKVNGKPLKLIAADMVADVALYQTDEVCPCVPIAKHDMKPGDEVLNYGYPYGAEIGIQFRSQGVYKGKLPEAPEAVQLQMAVEGMAVRLKDMSVLQLWGEPGVSGSGLFIKEMGHWALDGIMSMKVGGNIMISTNTALLHKFLHEQHIE